MLGAAKAAAEEAGRANITFIQGDAMIANTFHGAPDHTRLARAVPRTLEPGDTFVVINWWPKPREETVVLGKPRGPRPELRLSPHQVACWVEPAGFELARVEDVGPYHYGAVFTARATPP